MKPLQLSSIIIILLLSFQNSWAQTPYAAEINYRSLGNNLYSIQLEVFRQCSSIPPATQLSIEYNSTTCAINNSLSLQQISVTDITPTCPTGGNFCAIGKGFLHCIYEDTLTLTPCSDWVFSYNECCRDSMIINIQSVDTSAIYTETSLDNTTQENNSAILTGDGYIPFCIGANMFHYAHAYDLDDDSLSFSLVSVLGTNGNLLTYVPGYSPTHIGIDPVYIDPYTGELSFTRTALGSFILSIRIDEFRNGVLIASSYKDRTFSSNNCYNHRSFLNFNGSKEQNIQGGYLKGNIFYVDDPVQLSFDLPIIDFQDSIQLSSSITSIGGNYTLTGGNQSSTATLDTFLATFTWQKSPPVLQEFMISVQDNHCDTTSLANSFRIGYAIRGIDCMPQPIQASVCKDSFVAFCPTCSSGTLLKLDTIFSPLAAIYGTLSLDSNQCIQYLAGNNIGVQDSFWLYFGGNGGTWMDSTWVNITTVSCILADDTKLNKTTLSDHIRIYPNPTPNHLQVHSKELILTIKIYDLVGKHLKTIPSNKKVEQLDFSNFEHGTYILKIQTKQGVYSKKVQYY